MRGQLTDKIKWFAYNKKNTWGFCNASGARYVVSRYMLQPHRKHG